MEQGSRSVKHKGQGKGIWIWACRWGCTELTWRHREEQMQKSLESGAVKRSICRRRTWAGKRSQWVTNKEWWLHGCLTSERLRWCTRGTAPCDFTGWSAEISCWSLTFFLSLQLLCSPCSGVNKRQGDRGQAGTSCIIFQHLKDQHFCNPEEEEEVLKAVRVRESDGQVHCGAQRAGKEGAEQREAFLGLANTWAAQLQGLSSPYSPDFSFQRQHGFSPSSSCQSGPDGRDSEQSSYSPREGLEKDSLSLKAVKLHSVKTALWLRAVSAGLM